MATVQQGFGGKPTRIRVSARDTRDYKAEIWIEQEGVRRYAPYVRGGGDNRTTDQFVEISGGSETLAYATLNELLALRDECNAVIQELVK